MVGWALAARPWVGGHVLGTTKTGLISHPNPAPASRAGTSVAPEQSCAAFPTWIFAGSVINLKKKRPANPGAQVL